MQNRESTEGYSKSIVRKNNDKFGKRIGLNTLEHMQKVRDLTQSYDKRPLHPQKNPKSIVTT